VRQLLDTLGGLFCAGLLLLAGIARGETVHGAQIPDGSQKVGENRYRAKEDYEGTLKYYKTIYPPAQYPRRQIANQPGIKAVHISNPSGKNFEGLNIYLANDEVRIYIVPVAEAAKPKKKASEGKPAKR
jgi:hypothetical protein